MRVIQIPSILSIQDKQARDACSYQSGEEMSKNKVTRLCDWRLDHPIKEDRGSTEGRDDDRRTVDIPKRGTSGHDRFDQQNSPKSSNPGEQPCFIFQWNFAEPRKGWKRQRRVWWTGVGGSITSEPRDDLGQLASVVTTKLELLRPRSSSTLKAAILVTCFFPEGTHSVFSIITVKMSLDKESKICEQNHEY